MVADLDLNCGGADLDDVENTKANAQSTLLAPAPSMAWTLCQVPVSIMAGCSPSWSSPR